MGLGPSRDETIVINLFSWSNVYPSDGRLSTMKTAGLLQGTLDMLILRTLLFGPAHGHQIAKHIQSTTDDLLRLEHGSLYPALHRLERQGWVAAKWEVLGKRKRECKYYRLTPAGRKQLTRRGVQLEPRRQGDRQGHARAGQGVR